MNMNLTSMRRNEKYEQPVHGHLHQCRQFTQTNGLSSMCQKRFEKIVSGVKVTSVDVQVKCSEANEENVLCLIYTNPNPYSDAIKIQET
jgi:hypothetical protein